MGLTFVWIFLGVFALAIGQGIARRARNPYEVVSYEAVPEELRRELERVLPGYTHRESRLTRRRDEARLEGDYLGENVRVEGEFDSAGRMIEGEVDSPRPTRKTGLAAVPDLPEAVVQVFERVLEMPLAELDRCTLTCGTSRDEAFFELNGIASQWKWEVSATETGRLLEVEREKRR